MNALQMYAGAAMPPARRTIRRPAHPFNLQTVPFAISPFFIAPVLPGETLQNLWMQARVVTDPINNPLIGWWKEYYFFYVKLSDLYEREDFREMLLNPAKDMSSVATALGTAGDVNRYFAGGASQINYVKACQRVCIDHYFRDEDETYADNTITDTVSTPNVTFSAAQFVGNSVLDSVQLSDLVEGTSVLPTVVNEAGTATVDAQDISDAITRWQMAKLYNLTELSYEEYLAAQGINVPGVVAHRPELVRYVREWSYPTNTIDPTNGTPRSAVSWSIRERADKNRFFAEPGFLLGLTVTRPKVYLSKQDGSFTAAMNDYKAWLPSFLHQVDANVSKKELAHDNGPLQTIVTDTDGYWVDIKDLFLYGEQYVNYALSATGKNMMPVPVAGLTNKRYPTAFADITALFVTPASAVYVKEDGVVNLGIASSRLNPMVDTTPRGGTRSDQTSGGF